MQNNQPLDKRQKNRVTYLINELLEDLANFIPLEQKIVVIIKDGEYEDYEHVEYDAENDVHEPIVIYSDEEYYISTIKETLFLFFALVNDNVPYASAVLTAIRHIYGISQQEMANQLGITRQALSQMEKGDRSVSKNVIKKICLLDDFDEQDFKEKKA